MKVYIEAAAAKRKECTAFTGRKNQCQAPGKQEAKQTKNKTLTGERMFTGEITGGMKNERREY